MKNLLSNLTPPSIAKTLALTGFVASVAFVANPASAGTLVTYNGYIYDFTSVTNTTFNANSSLLTQQDWWGNAALANALSLELVKAMDAAEAKPDTKRTLTDLFATSTYFDSTFGFTRFGSSAARQDATLDPRTEKTIPLNTFSVFTTPATTSGNTTGTSGLNFVTATKTLAPSAPSAVPEPLTIFGSITAAGFGVAFKRKKNSNKE
jgi:hypothetical protein